MLRAKPVDVAPLAKHRPSLADVMKECLRRVRTEGKATIEALLPSEFTRLDVVFVFLAVLELLRIGQATAAFEGDELYLLAVTK
jgi:chromatin segregation and condensation protein Rec8/ScpA/Scc1 (kleisin family)